MSEHTPGAMRAAKEATRKWFMRPVSTTEEDIARIIDEESGLADLLEAARVVVGCNRAQFGNKLSESQKTSTKALEAAITKTEA